MARIVFYEPAAIYSHVFQRYHMPRLGPILLATILQREGHDVSVYSDAIQTTTMQNLLDADLVGISSITSTVTRAYETADFLRSKGVPVVLGGPHVTFMAEEGLQHADYVFRGEADKIITPLVDAILSGDGLEDIPGLSFRRNGEIVYNGPAPLVQDLDELPNPDFSLLWRTNKIPLKYLPAAIMTSRGCPYNCSFCSVTKMFGKEYRFRSTEQVLEDLSLMDLEGRRLFFCDDHLAANETRLYELLEGVLSRDLKFSWAAQVRVNVARNEKLLSLMRRCGCRTLYLGFESINPATLASYNKHQTVQEIESSIHLIRKYGIRIYGMFVFGADTDTIETVDATSDFAIRNGIETYQTLILTPLPGTTLFEEFKQQGRLLTNDWSKYNTHHLVFEPAMMKSEELHLAIIRGLKKFYSVKRIVGEIIRLRFSEAGSKIRNRRANLLAGNR